MSSHGREEGKHDILQTGFNIALARQSVWKLVSETPTSKTSETSWLKGDNNLNRERSDHIINKLMYSMRLSSGKFPTWNNFPISSKLFYKNLLFQKNIFNISIYFFFFEKHIFFYIFFSLTTLSFLTKLFFFEKLFFSYKNFSFL